MAKHGADEVIARLSLVRYRSPGRTARSPRGGALELFSTAKKSSRPLYVFANFGIKVNELHVHPLIYHDTKPSNSCSLCLC